MNLIAVWGTDANPFANPEKANDGGGYSQPCGGAVYATESGELVSRLMSRIQMPGLSSAQKMRPMHIYVPLPNRHRIIHIPESHSLRFARPCGRVC